MVVIGQSCYILEKWLSSFKRGFFLENWLYSGKSGYIPGKEVVFG